MHTMQIPTQIQPVLDDYVALVHQQLPDFVTGLYLYGSIALGGFNEHFSDIDFITVISRRCTESDIACLRDIHQTLEAKYPQWVFDGSYLQPQDIGKFDISPYPYYHDGKLHPSGQHEINSVTWWILKNKGIAVVGDIPDFSVDWDLLVANMRENLNTYWANWTKDWHRLLSLLTDGGVRWSVLGVLRQYYTFQEQDITSKENAGEYGLTHLPKKWHRIIQEAINLRWKTEKSLYRWRIVRALEAYRFLKYMIHRCNTTLF